MPFLILLFRQTTDGWACSAVSSRKKGRQEIRHETRISIFPQPPTSTNVSSCYLGKWKSGIFPGFLVPDDFSENFSRTMKRLTRAPRRCYRRGTKAAYKWINSLWINCLYSDSRFASAKKIVWAAPSKPEKQCISHADRYLKSRQGAIAKTKNRKKETNAVAP